MSLLQARLSPTSLMSDGLENEGRPAKRMRMAPPDDDRRSHPTFVHPGSSDYYHNAPVFDEQAYSLSLDVNPSQIPNSFPPWTPTWSSPGLFVPPSDMLLPMGPNDSFGSWASVSPVQEIVPNTADDPITTQTPNFTPQSPPSAPAASRASFSSAAPRHGTPLAETQPRFGPTQRDGDRFTNPFTECVDTFGTYRSLQFQRPANGMVNGYVKFNWVRPTGETGRVEELPDDDTSKADVVSHTSSQSSKSTPSPPPSYSHKSYSASPSRSVATLVPQRRASQPILIHSPQSVTSDMPFSVAQQYMLSMNAPQMVPAHFGHESIMDTMGRKLWRFCTSFIMSSKNRRYKLTFTSDINNWCPGRSVLKKTNLWVADFARLEGRDGVIAAIQSLAGIYIYDYQPTDVVKYRVNQRYMHAENRLAQLLKMADSLNSEQVAELVTISAILSMQDIVLVERRRQRPYLPRWLEGFQLCEYFLRKNDKGSRFWHRENVQTDSLHMSQAVIIGRGLILAQPMMPLSSPQEFDYTNEAQRFTWLLYGSEKDAFEIHGGCGFSKRLLHAMSQVTCFAARLQQDPKSVMLPKMALHLEDQLMNLRQWSPESTSYERSQEIPQPIEWVRDVSMEYRISTSAEMTDITAEAWRLAAVLYFRCRLLRLPRNHPDVISDIADLAKCITIMPTSGSHFTAQAPLFPVFLLGLLGSVPAHKDVAIGWFENVVRTPVRSVSQNIPLSLATLHVWEKERRKLPKQNAVGSSV